MIKTNLPVILLKDLVLLPHQEVRIEVSNDISKKVIDISALYHNDEVLIVCPTNTLEESPDTSDLPKYGVIGKIKSKIDLPNGSCKVVIVGKERVKVYNYVNYSNEEDVLESLVTPIKNDLTDEIEETAILRKLISQLDYFINTNPFISNSILSEIKGITDLDKLTDIIAAFVPLSNNEMMNLMTDPSSISRAKTLIKDIQIECAVLELEEKIENNLKNSLDNEQKDFILREKVKIIKNELGEKNNKELDIEELKAKVSKSNLPKRIEEKLNVEIKRYELTPESSPEITVIRNYIDTLLDIPWNKSKKEESNLKTIEKKLNNTHYSLEEVKTRIIEYIAVKKHSSKVSTPVLCLVGPPGVGKTTFAYSVADSLDKEFSKISLGGLSDNAELVGHRRTYIGSSPGKIIKSLIKTKVNNPVILLDEVDKLARDFRGDPSSTLLDILDIAQNKKFIDNYVEENVDLSNIFFILTANDKRSIAPALLDRLEVIELSGYTDYEKLDIAKNHLIKKALEVNALSSDSINFEDKTIFNLIENYTYESGVRELDRLINKIVRKVITENVKANKKLKKVTIASSDLNKYVGSVIFSKKNNKKNPQGVVNALAANSNGGSVVELEVISYPGNGEFKVTGSLGKVMKESVDVSLSYIKSNFKSFGIDSKLFNSKDFHIHVREGAVSKEGPSAGIAITTALLSHLLEREVKSNISMTGEITLTGEVLEIGGLKEKSLAAARNNINTVFIPKDNKKDLVELDKNILNKVNFRIVNNYKEVFDYIFKNNK